MKIDLIGCLAFVLFSTIKCNLLNAHTQIKSTVLSNNGNLNESNEKPKLMDSVFTSREVKISSSDSKNPQQPQRNEINSEISVSTNDSRMLSMDFNKLESPVIISRHNNSNSNNDQSNNMGKLGQPSRISQDLTAEAKLIAKFEQAIKFGLE